VRRIQYANSKCKNLYFEHWLILNRVKLNTADIIKDVMNPLWEPLQSLSAFTNSEGYYSFPGTIVSGTQAVGISYSGLANSLIPSCWTLSTNINLPITDKTFSL
jgi:hypothetical protein